MSKWKDYKAFFTKKENYMVIVIVGILLFVLAMPRNGGSGKSTGNNAENTTQKSSSGFQGLFSGSNYSGEDATYLYECEEKLALLLGCVEGIGETKVMLTRKDGTKDTVEGIVVAATGADNDDVKMSVTKIVQALFNIDAHKIKVVKMKSD